MVLLFESSDQIELQFRSYEAKGIKIGAQSYVLIRAGKLWFLTESECPHAGAVLNKAHINQQVELVCPMHAFTFDLFSGQESKRRCRALRTYRVVEKDGGLWADI